MDRRRRDQKRGERGEESGLHVAHAGRDHDERRGKTERDHDPREERRVEPGEDTLHPRALPPHVLPVHVGRFGFRGELRRIDDARHGRIEKRVELPPRGIRPEISGRRASNPGREAPDRRTEDESRHREAEPAALGQRQRCRGRHVLREHRRGEGETRGEGMPPLKQERGGEQERDPE